MSELLRGVEIERKFVIVKPCVCDLKREKNYTVSEIEQIYLKGAPNATRRVRRRRMGDLTRYYETVKTRIDRMSVIEDEGEISEDEYITLSREILEGTRPIHKVRHTFSYGELTVEIDIYDEWEDTCILECELPSRDYPLTLPDFITVVREVTGEKPYSNASMARVFPKELISDR